MLKKGADSAIESELKRTLSAFVNKIVTPLMGLGTQLLQLLKKTSDRTTEQPVVVKLVGPELMTTLKFIKHD